jgi:ParB-like chromosome segregation protein Spo0J
MSVPLPRPGAPHTGPHTATAIVMIAVSRLAPGHSPRLEGEDPAHVRTLAGIEGPLPPILVHRTTMRVIDGVHRLRAAILRGERTIAVCFFDGTQEAAFVRAVELNVAHGLPLSAAARQAAAARIVASYPHWSNRAIARSSGLSATTVAAIRARPSDLPPPEARIGRDGRMRPLNIEARRRCAAEVIAAQPDASLRQIAKAAGISLGTALDVRNRLRSGEDPVSPDRRPGGRPAGPTPAGPDGQVDSRDDGRALVPPPQTTTTTTTTTAPPPESLARWFEGLRRDPSLRHSEQGRTVVRWLDQHVVRPDELTQLVEAIPPHSGYAVAELALACAEAWRHLAEELQRRQNP